LQTNGGDVDTVRGRKLPDETMPLVSIGVPIYNEERFLAEALSALAQQSYRNIEIIISDNASTDQSEKICRDAAHRDSRIEYVRQTSNVGSASNFQFVRARAKGRYFMWAAGHDLWSPQLVEKAVQLMENDPSVVLASASVVWIDADGAKLDIRSDHTDSRGMDAIQRFNAVLWGSMNPVLGVIRLDVLDATDVDLRMVGSDLVMLGQLALIGPFALVDGAIFSRRVVREPESYDTRVKRYTSSEFKLTTSGLSSLFPLARLPFALARSITRSNLRLSERAMLIIALLGAMPARYLSGIRTIR
jgi:glycosyltransferase involved in cell wall biosynthesis